MDRSALLELRKQAHLTPHELREKAPDLSETVFDVLGEKVRGRAASRISDASERLVDAVKNVPEISEQDSLGDVVQRAAESDGDEEVKKEAKETAKRSGLDETVAEAAGLDMPIGVNPAFEEQMRAAEVFELSEVTNLPDSVAQTLVDINTDLSSLNASQLSALQEEGKIVPDEAKQVASATSLYRVLDARPELVDAVQDLEDRTITNPVDLVGLGPEMWEQVLTEREIDPPTGLSREEYAAGLDRKVANLFPAATVARSLQTIDVGAALQGARQLTELQAVNPDRSIFKVRDFSALETGDLGDDTLDSLRERFQSVQTTLNRYPGLGLRDVLADESLSWQEKQATVERRTNLVDSFLQEHADEDLFGLDLAHGSEAIKTLDFGNVPEEARSSVLSTLKAYQRAFSLTEDVRHGEKVIEGGFGSATSVAETGRDSFVDAVDLDREAAESYYDEAVETAAGVGAKVGIPLENFRDLFNQFGVSNQDSEVETFLQEVPGYEDYFGPQDYCDCEHCRSILSPAAYFADLMGFVDEHVTKKKYFNTSPPESHPLSLKSRRPDLWDLELTCENTTGTVPYLDIINEVLENAVALDSGEMDRDELEDREEVKNLVYGKELPQTGGDAVDSFDQPFQLPFEQIQIYLEHFDPTLGDVARALQATSKTQARSELGLSDRTYQLITQPKTSLDFLRSVYGIPELTLDGTTVVASTNGATEAPDAQQFLDATHLSRDEFGRIVETEYVTGSDTPIDIRGEKRTPESVQNDIERVYGLTTEKLDRAHRFTRLWRALPWSIEELDLALDHLTSSGVSTGIEAGNANDPGTLSYIGRLRQAQKGLDVGVDKLIALWDEMPTQSTADGKDALFDRVFNAESFLEMGQQPWDRNNTPSFLHPAFKQGKSSEAEPKLRRLLAATGLDADAFLGLLKGLAGPSGPLGIDLSTNSVSHRSFKLTRAHLSVLYRHARLAKLLDVEPDTLLRLLAIEPDISGGYIDGINELEAALDIVSWWKQAPWSVAELEYLLGGDRPESVPEPSNLATAVVERVQNEQMLVFTDTLFSAVDGITETQSKAIIDENPSRFVEVESAGDSSTGTVLYRLSASFDFSASLNLPQRTDLDPSVEPDLRNTLRDYDSGRLIPALLAEEIGMDRNRLQTMLDLLGTDTGSSAFMDRFSGSGNPGTPIADLAARLLPLTVLIPTETFDESDLAFLQQKPGAVGITDIKNLDFRALRGLEAYSRLRKDLDDPTADSLRQALRTLQSTGDFTALDAGRVAKALSVDESLVDSLFPRLSVEKTGPEALVHLASAAQVGAGIGIGGEAMEALLATGYAELDEGASALAGAFRAKHDDEEEYETAVRPFRDRVRSKKRDGLVEYLLYSVRKDFDDPSDLYHYYLLDVELEGCARTSPIVAANSSLQLYVQRVLMNLEQTGEEDEEESEQKAHVPPEAIPEDQWAWRKRYRLWEANRKVFLYPENYLEPGLRDNKSPLFERLEEELLSQEINDQNVRQAYARYLRGFEEVANLSIAGAYHETSGDADVLHLFGATSDDPPQYYYRRVEDAKSPEKTQWKPWRKIEVQIPTDTVSPIVHQGRLYLFWTRYVTKPRQEFNDGTSEFQGYRHTITVSYTKQRVDGSWVEPQEVTLGENPFDAEDEGRIVSSGWVGRGSFDFPEKEYNWSKKFDELKEGFNLHGFGWDRVYPWRYDGQLILWGADFRMASPLNLYEGRIEQRLDETRDTAFQSQYGRPFINPAVGVFMVIAQALGAELEVGPWLWGDAQNGDTNLYSYSGGDPILVFSPYAQRSILLKGESDRMLVDTVGLTDTIWPDAVVGQLSKLAKQDTKLATLDDGVNKEIVAGSPTDCILSSDGGSFLLQEGVRDDDKYLLRRLSTDLADNMGEDLFSLGIDEMLSTENQLKYEEPADLPFDITESNVADETEGGELDFDGPMGVYFREIFFHIPVLIANHLNSQQKYDEAREWYHKVFNPTANEVGKASSNGSGSTSGTDDRPDRPWRYREFRKQDVEQLRAMLEDRQAVEAYKEDPFNPHAIARERLTAYQKSVVMKYVDNLVDWGDELFARDTRESVREATLYYTMASDILGERPDELGGCGEGEGENRSYDALKDDLRFDVSDPDAQESEFLPEIESFMVSGVSGAVGGESSAAGTGIEMISTNRARRLTARSYVPSEPELTASDGGPSVSSGDGESDVEALTENLELESSRAVRVNYADVVAGQKLAGRDGVLNRGDPVRPDVASPEVGSSFGLSFTRQVSPVFCIPNNEKLLDYWDRVDDRLYKIRHCLNIEGERRSLSLFAPPVSPDMLVRATASGMSIAEAMEAVTGNVPPYRFEYLLQKAKEYVGRLQDFGSTLQSAIEKRDAEELTKLRNTHQKNLQNLTESIKEQELEAAQKELERLQKRKDLVNYRKEHYDSLISKGLIPTEEKKKRKRVTAKDLRTIAGTLDTMAGIVHLIPDVGAPTAMKFGGSQLGDSSGSWSSVLKTIAGIQETQARVAGMKATFQRRKQRWEHQKKQAEKELSALEKQIRGAEIRQSIAESTLERHRQKQEQLDEIIDFHEEKFSNHGLYTWLADELQSLYRDAYNVAYGFVRMAARAYEFERNEYPEVSTNAWEASRSGLLSGERLMIDLERMEKQYIETDYRSKEIEQSFSLSQINPAALIKLKETGACTFKIPEFYFDLFYPGQYRRRIKAVRVSIPCVTGPHTNVSAKLTLKNSWIRRDPNSFDPENPTNGQVQLPPTRSTSVAASTAQNDSGVFNLNFRGDRYMPFEGAGAISKWRLQLPDPEGLPPFDYDTISDVTLTISYTAEESGTLRSKVSKHIRKVQRKLSESAQTRVISLRRELSPAFNRLVRSPAGTDVEFEISAKHFPTFVQGQQIEVSNAFLVVETEDASLGSVKLSIDDTPVPDSDSSFQERSEYGDLEGVGVDKNLFGRDPQGTYKFKVEDPGGLAPGDGQAALDSEKLEDIYLALTYEIPDPSNA